MTCVVDTCAMCVCLVCPQRLIASMPHLEYAVRRAGPLFGEYVACMDHCSERRLALLHAQYGGQYRQSTPITEEATLASIQYACIYLATKMVRVFDTHTHTHRHTHTHARTRALLVIWRLITCHLVLSCTHPH